MSFQQSIDLWSSRIVWKNRKIREHLVSTFKDNVQEIFAESSNLGEVRNNILFSDDAVKGSYQVDRVRNSAGSTVGAMTGG